jgi:anti-sigma regulatory factor (Ser/Thr protein kinase)
MSGRRAVIRAELPPDLHAAARGRALVERVLQDAPSERAWDAEVLVSEVVTNAVLHGTPDPDDPPRLTVEADEGRLRVEVEDGGPGIVQPERALPDPTATSGRGLALVGGLADRWGVERLPSRVWFELELGHPSPPREA